MDELIITRKILKTIRENSNKKNKTQDIINEDTYEKDNFLRRAEILMEEAEDNKNVKDFVIKSNDTQFSNLRTSQEESLRRTIGDVELEDDALVYHHDIDDITLDGMIRGLNIKFQFRYNDPSGDGCYITTSNLQLTDANTKTIEKIRAAFQNWKQGLSSDGNTMKDLEKAAERRSQDYTNG